MMQLASSLSFRYCICLYVSLYLTQIIYAWLEKISQFKSLKLAAAQIVAATFVSRQIPTRFCLMTTPSDMTAFRSPICRA